MFKSKTIKILGSLALSASILSGVPNSVSAVENDLPIYAPVYDGTVYQSTLTNTLVKLPKWTHIATNTSSLVDTVNYEVSRRVFATGTLTGETEFKILQNGLKVTAEVSYGTDTTTSTKFAFNIPPKSTRKLVYGSIGVDTTGKLVTYSNGLVSRSKAVSADYSRYSYSENLAY